MASRAKKAIAENPVLSPLIPSAPGPKRTYKELKDQYGGFQGYLQFLDSQYKQLRDQLIAEWTPDKVRQEAIKVADQLGIDRAVMLGIMDREASFRPQGLFGNSVEKALRANSSAYGIGGITGTAFSEIENEVPFEHKDLVYPQNAIYAVGLLIKKLLQRYGGDEKKAFAHWTGEGEKGAQHLASFVDKYRAV
jgi:hypothetical protein